MTVKMVNIGQLGMGKTFSECCKETDTLATKRQWKKWQKGKGKAFTHFKSGNYSPSK